MKFKVVILVLLIVLALLVFPRWTNTGKLPSDYFYEEVESDSDLADWQKPNNSSCCAQHSLEFFCSKETPATEKMGDLHCTCADFIQCKLVIVTALSSNHFKESTDFFGSVLAIMPGTQIIVYDLGLSKTQVTAIESYCNVKEVRKFNFGSYPLHTKQLFKYAWKPHLISEVSQDYELFLYCDSSCRITNSFMNSLPSITKFPIVSLSRLRAKNTIIRFTHPAMLNYLRINKTREEIATIMPRSFQAGVLLVWANEFVKQKVLSPWVDCANHLMCIAPPGSGIDGCNFNKRPMSEYIGCHRFDQSALNMILVREFGEDLNTIFEGEGDIMPERVVEVDHTRTTHYNNKKSHKCNIRYT